MEIIFLKYQLVQKIGHNFSIIIFSGSSPCSDNIFIVSKRYKTKNGDLSSSQSIIAEHSNKRTNWPITYLNNVDSQLVICRLDLQFLSLSVRKNIWYVTPKTVVKVASHISFFKPSILLYFRSVQLKIILSLIVVHLYRNKNKRIGWCLNFKL